MTVGQRIRQALFAGLLVLGPIAVTAWLLVFLVGFLEGIVRLLPDAIQPENLLGFPIPGLGLVLAVITVLFVGLVTRSYVGGRIVVTYERLLARVPVLSGVYSGVKQLMEALFAGERGNFRKVVMIEWPRRGVRAIAFHTGESFVQPDSGEVWVNIFLPTTPNPTSGYYLVIPEHDVVLLDLSVEDAFKLIMSAGIVAPRGGMRLKDDGAWPVGALPTEEITRETP